MKTPADDKVEEYPDTPPWTMFFDGPLYQKYDEFMKTKDFSKILLNTKLRLANSQGPEVVSSTHSFTDEHWEKEQDADPTGNTYPYVSEDFYRRVKAEQKRRTRRTRAFILLGLVIMAALAFGTALVIHYFFIPPFEERNPKNFVNVSFSVNTTSSNVSDIDQTTPMAEDISNLLDIMAGDPHHHDHDHDHDHVLNPSGKIFDDHLLTTTQAPPARTTDYSTMKEPEATSLKTTTSTKLRQKFTKSTEYLLHLKPKETEESISDTELGNASTVLKSESPSTGKQKKYTSTIELNHMDFFGMDDFFTTTSSTPAMSAEDFFAIDGQTTTSTTTPKSTKLLEILAEQVGSQMTTSTSVSSDTRTTQSKVDTSEYQIPSGRTITKKGPLKNGGSVAASPANTTILKETTTSFDNSTVLDWDDNLNTTYFETTSASNGATTGGTFETNPKISDALHDSNSTNSSQTTTGTVIKPVKPTSYPSLDDVKTTESARVQPKPPTKSATGINITESQTGVETGYLTEKENITKTPESTIANDSTELPISSPVTTRVPENPTATYVKTSSIETNILPTGLNGTFAEIGITPDIMTIPDPTLKLESIIRRVSQTHLNTKLVLTTPKTNNWMEITTDRKRTTTTQERDLTLSNEKATHSLVDTTTVLSEQSTYFPETANDTIYTSPTVPEMISDTVVTTTKILEMISDIVDTTTTFPEMISDKLETSTILHEMINDTIETTTIHLDINDTVETSTTPLQMTNYSYTTEATTIPLEIMNGTIETTEFSQKMINDTIETAKGLPEMTKSATETATPFPEMINGTNEAISNVQETTNVTEDTTTHSMETTSVIMKTIPISSETTHDTLETTTYLPEATKEAMKTTTNWPETTTDTMETVTTLSETTTLQETTTNWSKMTTAAINNTTNWSETTAIAKETTRPETATPDKDTTSTFPETTSDAVETTSTLPETTTTIQETTTLPENYNTIKMHDVTSFTFENASIECTVKHAIRWQSLSVKINQNWRPLEVTLYPSGDIEWSSSKTKRHGVTYDVINSTDGTGSNITLGLIIHDVQCRDANTYFCTLKSKIEDRVARSDLIVVGKPSQKITLTFGPSIIEDKAFRITASWQGGYPIPWTNMSWTAVDSNNQSYNLADYGEYRDYELHEDHKFCQTTLKHSIVVFPKAHLNDTTVIVKPNLQKKKFFVDPSMEKYLENVEPGIDKILVIPMGYCKNGDKDMSIPHPYTPCSKFLRCLPGDMVVQACPVGTCFYEKRQGCA